MKYKWLNKQNNNKLIVFFNGWGMDETVVKHLEPEILDVIMFYDYNSLSTDFDFNLLKNYFSKYLIARSMGVMTATLFQIDYDSKTAVNGTLKPIDDKYGIPNRIYDLTIKNLTPSGLIKFIENMGLNSDIIPEINNDFENQKSALLQLKNYQSNPKFKYDRIILSSDDKIIPSKNQSKFWGIEPNTQSGHSPFHLFKKWSDLL